jgi:hypothetical protein
MAVDDMNRVGRELASTLDDVGEHRPAGERMQNLRHVRAHAFAESGGEDDDG